MRTPRPDHRQLKLKFVMWDSQPTRRQIVDHVYLFLRLKADSIMANWPSTKCIPVDARRCTNNYTRIIRNTINIF